MAGCCIEPTDGRRWLKMEVGYSRSIFEGRKPRIKATPGIDGSKSKVTIGDPQLSPACFLGRPPPLPELPEIPEFESVSEPLLFRSNSEPVMRIAEISDFDSPGGFEDVSPLGLAGVPPLAAEVNGEEPNIPNVEAAQEEDAKETEEVPMVTALEIMEATNPAEATLEIEEALTALDTYVRGQNSEEHVRKNSRAQFQAAVRVGCWTVILSLPIIVWPWALYLQEVSTAQREYLGYWGSMLLQFLFCIGPTLGASTKYTLEGWLGTSLATINMLLLNNAFGPWLFGGAYQNRIEYFNNSTGELMPTSRWLPLCNNGHDLSFNSCFMNMNTALAENAEYAKAMMVLLDFILFVLAMLTFGFNTNVRVFSISTHAFYVMSFLDPSTGSFDISPSLAANYWTIVTGASVGVILCFLIPTPITATSKARTTLLSTGSAVAMVLESLPLTPSELCRSKSQAAMDEIASLMKDLDSHLQVMWFEDFGILRQRASYRRWLQAFYEILKISTQNIDAVLCAAAALPSTQGEQDFPKTYEAGGNFLLPPALVFCLAVTGVVEDTCQALSSLALYGIEENMSLCDRICRYFQSLQSHVEIRLYERSITHPRFVLRYTLTLTITFVIGWLGVANVIAPYSSQPSSTVSVIIYTFTASSLPLTLKRFNGVLLGKVLGSVAQRLLAVRTPGHAICFALFQLVSVVALVYAAFHSQKHGGVALLTVAYAMSALIPGNGIFREEAVKVTSSDGSFLFVTMVGTFIGVAVLLLVDLVLASSATRQARQRLLRGLNRVHKFAGQVLDPEDPGDSKPKDVEAGEDLSEDVLGKLQAGIYEDLDEVANLLPYAADEPSPYGRPFPVDLCLDLEKGLRGVARHFRTISWAIQLLEKPQKQLKLKAGSRIFKAGRAPKASVPQPAIRNELFRPILATLAEEIQKMLENIRVLTVARLHSSKPWRSNRGREENDEEAEQKLLRSKLYTKTVSNAFCKIARSPWKLAWKAAVRSANEQLAPLAPEIALPSADVVTPTGILEEKSAAPLLRRSASNPILTLEKKNSWVSTSITDKFAEKKAAARAMLVAASKQGAKKIRSQQRALQKLAEKLANEKLEDELLTKSGKNPQLVLPPVTALEPGGAKQGVADNFAFRLLLLFDQLREVAAARRSDLPDDDPAEHALLEQCGGQREYGVAAGSAGPFRGAVACSVRFLPPWGAIRVLFDVRSCVSQLKQIWSRELSSGCDLQNSHLVVQTPRRTAAATALPWWGPRMAKANPKPSKVFVASTAQFTGEHHQLEPRNADVDEEIQRL
eukprot:Skav234444  [mRNA]  locus=scaffold1647:40426:54035:+ [translate_table: standard]